MYRCGVDMVLIAGLWLDATAWDAVVPALKQAGHNPIPVLLPGQGDGSMTAKLDDQVAAVTGAIDALPGPVLVVGHSAACTLAWIAADARPDKTAKVVMIGGVPSGDGETYANLFEYQDGATLECGAVVDHTSGTTSKKNAPLTLSVARARIADTSAASRAVED